MEWIITRLIKSIQKVFLDPKIDIFIFIVTNVHIVIRNEKAKRVLKLFSGACATVSDPLIKKEKIQKDNCVRRKK